MFSGDDVRGNAFIYLLFQVCNICLAILGFCTLCIAVYLLAVTKSFNAFSISFLCFGISLIILSYFGCNLKYSPFGNLIYIIALSVIFILDFIVTVFSFFYREEIIKWILFYYDQDDMSIAEATRLVNRNISAVNDFLLIIVFLFFLVVAFSWMYRRTLVANRAQFNKTPITDILMRDYESNGKYTGRK